MCHQYSFSCDMPETISYFGIQEIAAPHKPLYNIVPTKSVPVVRMEKGKRVLDSFRWGLMPFWVPDAINADLQSMQDNEGYYKIVERHRCIIPCNGFYYWRVEEKRKYPIRVVLRTNGMFGIAGLYEVWEDARKQRHHNCTMVMTSSNRLISEFNSRMPAILDADLMGEWLEPSLMEIAYLERMLKPADEARMRIYPVSPIIQHEHVDDQSCIVEMDLRQAWIKA